MSIKEVIHCDQCGLVISEGGVSTSGTYSIFTISDGERVHVTKSSGERFFCDKQHAKDYWDAIA